MKRGPLAKDGRWVSLVVVALFSIVFFSGCSAYTLRGRVIAGDISYVMVLPADDPRFEEGAGVAGVRVRLQNNPDRLNRKVIGETVSDSSGEFSVPVSEVGVGFLTFDVGLGARRKGYESVVHFFRLPPSSQRVLIMLAPGDPGAEWRKDDELYQQYKQFR